MPAGEEHKLHISLKVIRRNSLPQVFLEKIFGPDTTNIASRVVYNVNSFSKTAEPSFVKANPFGLKNMSGNVAEFCSDFYSDNLL